MTAKYQKYDGNFENWLVMLEKQLVTSLSILTSSLINYSASMSI